jgi:hypothetical protein
MPRLNGRMLVWRRPGFYCASKGLGYTYAGSLVESEMTVPVRAFSFDR